MILVGRYLSPFVRRTGVVLKTLGMPFEEKSLSTGDNAEEIQAINPVGRVPSLVLDGGETIVDSQAIVDYLLEIGDPDHALLPASGAERREVLRSALIAQGAMEKSVASAYERNRRPKDKVYQGWVDHVDGQAASALKALDEQAAGREWLHGDHMTLADINAVCALDFARIAVPYLVKDDPYPALEALAERCNAMPAFAETAWKG
ncbi:MAG: glutathione S-transferase family protein [Pseudomonadota bacterium]